MLTGFDIQLAHAVEEIGQEAWDNLAGQQPFADYRWYRYGETVLADDLPIYIILSRHGQAVGRATFWLKKQEQVELSSKLAARVIAMALKRWPLLVCRAPLADVCGWILPAPPERDAAIKAITQTAQAQAQRYHASFLLFDYLQREEAEWPEWQDTLLAGMIPGAGTRLPLTWPDFDSYLGHLAKSMQKDYRRHCHRADDLGIKITAKPLTGPLAESSLDQALALIRQVEQRHEASPVPWARAMLKCAYMVHATWLTAEIEGRLVGCGLLVGSGATQEMKLLGLDYSVRYVYFQIIYAAIRQAIESGRQVLYGGSGAYEIKHRLGFTEVNNNYIAYAANHWLLQRIARRWLNG